MNRILSDLVIELHDLGRKLHGEHPDKGTEVRKLADSLAEIGNELYERNSTTNLTKND
jgi:hypothetical protein